MMERKPKSRMRLVSLRAAGSDETADSSGPTQEIVGFSLGYRSLISEQAEVWTVAGKLADGTQTKEDIGELSFVLIPGDTEPATAITGFLAPSAPYVLKLPEAAVQEQLRSVIVQLGYDRDGYYLSVGIGGAFGYEENFRRE